MKKLLLSTAVLRSLLLGTVSPTLAMTESQAQSREYTYYVDCINHKCASSGLTPHDVIGSKWVYRVCGYAIQNKKIA